MADDKPGGDDLFEDLDKFFAPIRDVDWESEESTPASDTPQEEHVAVRPSEGEPIVIADDPDVTISAPPFSWTAATTSARRVSTSSTAATAAGITPVCPTMSGFAKLMIPKR